MGRYPKTVAALILPVLFPLAAFCGGRPLLVGISESFPQGDDSGKITVNASYADAVSRGGHIPVVIPRYGSDGQFDALVAKLDVLILTGGEDISPSRYGAEPSPKLGTVNDPRDRFDTRLLAAARRRNLPVVGICRGCQLLNVGFGGSLWQDLPSEFPAGGVKHRNVRHMVSIAPDSRLARATGKTEATVNSFHHQAVRDLAPGFRITAQSPDGVVEAIECDTYPAIGVQFHPERMLCEDDDPAFADFFANMLSLFGR